MAGKFLRRGAALDTITGDQRTNAIRKPHRSTRHPVTQTSCGCPDPNCGAWHAIRAGRTTPVIDEAIEKLATERKARKAVRRASGYERGGLR